MKKVVFYLFVLFNTAPLTALAQTSAPANNFLKKEQESFLRNIKGISTDSAIANSLSRFFDSEVNSIYASVASDAALPVAEKEKAVRSLVYFIKELGRNMVQQKSSLYEISATVGSYKAVLAALLYHKPLVPLLKPMSPRSCQALSSAFSQYKEHALLDDIAVYKRMVESPEFILQFLENKPAFRFADSLLLEAAAHDPMKLASYLNRNKPGIKELVRNTRNIYLKQIVFLAEDKNASELMPFISQLAENKITPEEILEKRTDVVQYFQLLVNAMQEAKHSKNTSSIVLKPLRSGIRQKSLSFYVDQINELHSAADPVRFASVKGLRPEDIYYIITSCGEELYTSSYLGLYKRLMGNFRDQSADSIFDVVQYDNFHVFMRLAANYNVLADFLIRMPNEKMRELVKRFITGIETDAGTGLERAMDIADAFPAIGSAVEVSAVIQAELQANLKRCTVGQQFLGVRLYGILLQVFDLVKQEGGIKKLWAKLGNYEILKRDALRNKNGEITQLVLFYGDEDGVASFNSFLKLYADTRKWEVSKNDNWIGIRSVTDQSISIYANRPLDIKEEMDLRAQDSLVAFLEQESLEPAVLVHRGHSYHLDKTMKRLKPSVKLAILGSCGGYNKALSIATINPDVQVIGSKKTGAKSINDPILDAINETLVEKKDLLWPEIWRQLADRFSKDPVALGLFNEYFPPSNNLSLFVLKLFVYHN